MARLRAAFVLVVGAIMFGGHATSSTSSSSYPSPVASSYGAYAPPSPASPPWRAHSASGGSGWSDAERGERRPRRAQATIGAESTTKPSVPGLPHPPSAPAFSWYAVSRLPQPTCIAPEDLPTQRTHPLHLLSYAQPRLPYNNTLFLLGAHAGCRADLSTTYPGLDTVCTVQTTVPVFHRSTDLGQTWDCTVLSRSDLPRLGQTALVYTQYVNFTAEKPVPDTTPYNETATVTPSPSATASASASPSPGSVANATCDLMCVFGGLQKPFGATSNATATADPTATAMPFTQETIPDDTPWLKVPYVLCCRLPECTEWVDAPDLPDPVAHATAFQFGRDIYVVGGDQESQETSLFQIKVDTETCQLDPNGWTVPILTVPIAPRRAAVMATQFGSKLLIGGGLTIDAAGVPLYPNPDLWSTEDPADASQWRMLTPSLPAGDGAVLASDRFSAVIDTTSRSVDGTYSEQNTVWIYSSQKAYIIRTESSPPTTTVHAFLKYPGPKDPNLLSLLSPSIRQPALAFDRRIKTGYATIFSLPANMPVTDPFWDYLIRMDYYRCADWCEVDWWTPGCTKDPLDAICYPCTVCGPEERTVSKCKVAFLGYTDTQCAPCSACPAGFEKVYSCNSTHDTLCVLSSVQLPASAVDATADPSLLRAAVLAIGVCVAAFVATSAFYSAWTLRSAGGGATGDASSPSASAADGKAAAMGGGQAKGAAGGAGGRSGQSGRTAAFFRVCTFRGGCFAATPADVIDSFMRGMRFFWPIFFSLASLSAHAMLATTYLTAPSSKLFAAGVCIALATFAHAIANAYAVAKVSSAAATVATAAAAAAAAAVASSASTATAVPSKLFDSVVLLHGYADGASTSAHCGMGRHGSSSSSPSSSSSSSPAPLPSEIAPSAGVASAGGLSATGGASGPRNGGTSTSSSSAAMANPLPILVLLGALLHPRCLLLLLSSRHMYGSAPASWMRAQSSFALRCIAWATAAYDVPLLLICIAILGGGSLAFSSATVVACALLGFANIVATLSWSASVTTKLKGASVLAMGHDEDLAGERRGGRGGNGCNDADGETLVSPPSAFVRLVGTGGATAGSGVGGAGVGGGAVVSGGGGGGGGGGGTGASGVAVANATNGSGISPGSVAVSGSSNNNNNNGSGGAGTNSGVNSSATAGQAAVAASSGGGAGAGGRQAVSSINPLVAVHSQRHQSRQQHVSQSGRLIGQHQLNGGAGNGNADGAAELTEDGCVGVVGGGVSGLAFSAGSLSPPLSQRLAPESDVSEAVNPLDLGPLVLGFGVGSGGLESSSSPSALVGTSPNGRGTGGASKLDHLASHRAILAALAASAAAISGSSSVPAVVVSPAPMASHSRRLAVARAQRSSTALSLVTASAAMTSTSPPRLAGVSGMMGGNSGTTDTESVVGSGEVLDGGGGAAVHAAAAAAAASAAADLAAVHYVQALRNAAHAHAAGGDVAQATAAVANSLGNVSVAEFDALEMGMGMGSVPAGGGLAGQATSQDFQSLMARMRGRLIRHPSSVSESDGSLRAELLAVGTTTAGGTQAAESVAGSVRMLRVGGIAAAGAGTNHAGPATSVATSKHVRAPYSETNGADVGDDNVSLAPSNM